MTVERASAPCSGLHHFFHAGACVVCSTKLACCRNCQFSYEGREPGWLACGHGVDDTAIAEEDETKNPIWAVRKYSFNGLRAMLSNGGQMVDGQDCEKLSPDDGRTCATFEAKDDL